MFGRLEEFINRYPSLRAARRVGVAISGGADSMFLARGCAELAAKFTWRLTLLHVNYGLRGAESDRDERMVRELAEELGVEAFVHRPVVEDDAEEALRNLRYQWFAESGCDAVLTGHTREDQAETVLFRILRGTGPTGLVGILPVVRGNVYRPMLEYGRDEVRTWLREQGHVWCEDSTNRDNNYRRNYIRNELLPELSDLVNSEAVGALAQLAVIQRDEEEWLGTMVDSLLEDFMEPGAPGLLVQCDYLKQVPRALQRRMMRRVLEQVKGNLTAIEFDHIERALALVDTADGHGRIQVRGLDLLRSFEWLRVARMDDLKGLEERNFRMPLAFGGELRLPDSLGVLRTTVEEICPYNENGGSLDLGRLEAALATGGQCELRNWRPGDSIHRRGGTRPEKLKELFQNFRVPIWQRRSWPIVVLGDSPVWAGGFGPAQEFAVGPATKRALRMEWIPGFRPIMSGE